MSTLVPNGKLSNKLIYKLIALPGVDEISSGYESSVPFGIANLFNFCHSGDYAVITHCDFNLHVPDEEQA